MKKSILRILAIVLALCLLTGTALAATVSASGGDSYLRSQPSLSGARLATFREGKTADYLGRSSVDDRGVRWYYVFYNDMTGWVSSKYTTLSGSLSAGSVRASGGDSYIRSEPNLSGKQLGLFPDGRTATYLDQSSVDSRGVRWYRVHYNDITGWVSSKYTKLDGALVYDTLYAVSGDSYIRSQPTLSGKQLGLFPDGASADYLDQSAEDERGVEWYRISYRGITGWVSSRYTSFSEDGYGDEDYYYYTVYADGGDSYIRSQPKLSGKQLGLFPDGAAADYLDQSSVDDRGVEWYRISYHGITGWVSSKYTYLD